MLRYGIIYVFLFFIYSFSFHFRSCNPARHTHTSKSHLKHPSQPLPPSPMNPAETTSLQQRPRSRSPCRRRAPPHLARKLLELHLDDVRPRHDHEPQVPRRHVHRDAVGGGPRRLGRLEALLRGGVAVLVGLGEDDVAVLFCWFLVSFRVGSDGRDGLSPGLGGTNGIDALELAPEDPAVGRRDAQVLVQQRGEVVPGLPLRRGLFHAASPYSSRPVAREAPSRVERRERGLEVDGMDCWWW